MYKIIVPKIITSMIKTGYAQIPVSKGLMPEYSVIPPNDRNTRVGKITVVTLINTTRIDDEKIIHEISFFPSNKVTNSLNLSINV